MGTCAISSEAATSIPVGMTIKRDESERILVQRAQRGEEDAFAALFELHKRRVYSVCLTIAKDMTEAEDLTQEVFLQVFRTVASFRGDSAFSTWLHRVAVNTACMGLRRRKLPPMLSTDEPVSSDSGSLRRDYGKSDPNLSGAIDRIVLRRAIEELPAGCRKIFVLHTVHGYQHHEIAQLLRCSVGTSKSQLHKAKVRMRNFLFLGHRGGGRSADGVSTSAEDKGLDRGGR